MFVFNFIYNDFLHVKRFGFIYIWLHLKLHQMLDVEFLLAIFFRANYVIQIKCFKNQTVNCIYEKETRQ